MKYYISSAAVSFLSLLVLFVNSSSTNVITALISFCVSLLPFLVDFVLFLNNTIDFKYERRFKILRRCTIGMCIVIGILLAVWLLEGIRFLQLPKDSTMYLCLNPDSDFLNGFNSSLKPFFSCVLSVSSLRIGFIFVFIVSVVIKFLDAKNYGQEIEELKKLFFDKT